MNEKRNSPSPRIMPLLIGLPVLYILSSGPGNWLTLKGYLSPNAAAVVYAPLFWIVDRCPASAQEAFGRWASFWHPTDWDQKLHEQLGEALAKEIFQGMADDFAPSSGTEYEELDSDEPDSAGKWAGHVFSLPTNAGTLVVTVNDPDTRVQVFKGEGRIEITRPGESSPITISVDPAKQRLKVKHDRGEFWATKFESHPGSKLGILAELVPLESASETLDATQER